LNTPLCDADFRTADVSPRFTFYFVIPVEVFLGDIYGIFVLLSGVSGLIGIASKTG
jgi:hypothetical protein